MSCTTIKTTASNSLPPIPPSEAQISRVGHYPNYNLGNQTVQQVVLLNFQEVLRNHQNPPKDFLASFTVSHGDYKVPHNTPKLQPQDDKIEAIASLNLNN